MNKVKVGIIGLGNIGKQHLAAWSRVPDVDLVGVVTSQRLNELDTYQNVQELVQEARPDLAVVCTPTDTHVELVTELLEAGCHVLCEKPLALTAEDAERLYTIARREHRMLKVAHVLRHFENYETVREKFLAGEIGRASTARLYRSVPVPEGKNQWFRDQDRSGGLALDLMIHDVDFLLRTFGAVDGVYAQQRQLDGRVVVIATLRFSSGAIGVLEGAWGGSADLEYTCELAGSKGNVWFSSVSSATVRVKDLIKKTTQLETPLRVDPFYQQALSSIQSLELFPVEETDDPYAISAIEVCTAINDSIRKSEPLTLELEGNSLQ